MLYSFVKILSRLACLLSPSLRRGVGNVVGAVCWPIVPRRRKNMAIDNIMCSLAVDRQQATDIAKKSATRFGRMFLEVLSIPKFNAANISQQVRIEGRQYLEEALSHGRGVVMATAHSGNWELAGAGLAMAGFPMVAVVQKQTNLAMDRFINEYRTRAGMHVTYKTGVREMVRLLGEGKVIGLLSDQDGGLAGVFVKFFGRMASSSQGAAALARMKDSPIVPAFVTENSEGVHTLILHPPVWVVKTDSREQDILVTTQHITSIIEQHIRKYPEEWFWLHNRWKTLPPQ